jgi:DNA-binding cell septation regulator SpoVG
MNQNSISVEIRPTTKPGPVKAYADVTYTTEEGSIQIMGFAVVQKDGKPPFVGPPSRAGTNPGRFFPIVELGGNLRQSIFKAILEAYAQQAKN